MFDEQCEHELNGYRHLTAEETSNHLTLHYKRAIRELTDDKLIAHPAGLTAFAKSVVLGDVFRRSAAGMVPWNMVLSFIFHETLKLGRLMEAQGLLGGGHPEWKEDDEPGL